jgi:hypothetical protein
MKKKLIISTLLITSLALSSCSFGSLTTKNSSSSSNEDVKDYLPLTENTTSSVDTSSSSEASASSETSKQEEVTPVEHTYTVDDFGTKDSVTGAYLMSTIEYEKDFSKLTLQNS